MIKYLTKSVLKKVYRKRKPWVHKGNFGRLLAIVGSERHTGSPIFVGLAAYRAGCDLVFLIGPKRPMDVAASYSPVLITEVLDDVQLEERHIPKILSVIDEVEANAIVIGPGLWRTPETIRTIIKLIREISLPMVIDADAIRAISIAKEILRGKRCVLTPHADEFRELANIKVTRDLKDRIKFVKEEARNISSTILLKGHVDVISDGRKVALNKTGSPFMTKGGCGDTLTGICGAFLARNVEPFIAACASAYINGKAGEFAAREYGEGLLPTDLIKNIPKVIKNV
jgi:NAD(P)H-hydrate epimerase